MCLGGLSPDLGTTVHFLRFWVGSNLALLHKSEPDGHSSVLNLSDADLTAEILCSWRSFHIPGPLNGTQWLELTASSEWSKGSMFNSAFFMAQPSSRAEVHCALGSHITSLQVPFLLLLSLWSMVNGEFHGLSFAAQQSTTVSHTCHNQLNSIPEQSHRCSGPRAQQSCYKCHQREKS